MIRKLFINMLLTYIISIIISSILLFVYLKKIEIPGHGAPLAFFGGGLYLLVINFLMLIASLPVLLIANSSELYKKGHRQAYYFFCPFGLIIFYLFLRFSNTSVDIFLIPSLIYLLVYGCRYFFIIKKINIANN